MNENEWKLFYVKEADASFLLKWKNEGAILND